MASREEEEEEEHDVDDEQRNRQEGSLIGSFSVQHFDKEN